jgi:hypothetical protein
MFFMCAMAEAFFSIFFFVRKPWHGFSTPRCRARILHHPVVPGCDEPWLLAVANAVAQFLDRRQCTSVPSFVRVLVAKGENKSLE